MKSDIPSLSNFGELPPLTGQEGTGGVGLTANLTKEQMQLKMTEENCYQSVSALSIAVQADMFGLFTVGKTAEDLVRVDILKRVDGVVTNVGSFEGRTVIEALLKAGSSIHRKFLSEFNGSELFSRYIKTNLQMDEVRRYKKPTIIVPSKS